MKVFEPLGRWTFIHWPAAVLSQNIVMNECDHEDD